MSAASNQSEEGRYLTAVAKVRLSPRAKGKFQGVIMKFKCAKCGLSYDPAVSKAKRRGFCSRRCEVRAEKEGKADVLAAQSEDAKHFRENHYP
jgi:uncharacterized OB-fold protein